MDGQGTKRRRNIAENFNRLSRAHERYGRQTDRRQTDGRRPIANVNVSWRSLKTFWSLFFRTQCKPVSVVSQCKLAEGYGNEDQHCPMDLYSLGSWVRALFLDRYQLQVNVNICLHLTIFAVCVCCCQLLSSVDGQLWLRLKLYIRSQNSWRSLVIVKITGLISVDSSRQTMTDPCKTVKKTVWKTVCQTCINLYKTFLIFIWIMKDVSVSGWPLNVFEYLDHY